jgi:V-type H+-transporting ATPase subunit C
MSVFSAPTSPQPEPKQTKRTLQAIQQPLAYLSSKSGKYHGKNKGSSNTEEVVGEYQTLMEQEFYDFVIFEVPWIII